MAVDRTRLPEPGPPLSFNFPEVRRRTLANGLRVCTIEHHEVPLVTCFVLMPIGSSQDPGHQPGLAAITGDLLDEGSGDLDALAVHEALGRIGAHLDTEIGADATLLELTTLEQYAPRALELLASMVWNPRLDPRDFDRVRELRLSRLVQLRDLPPAVADRVFTQLLYPEHPYGHLPIGTEEALRALTIADVTTFHRRVYTPKNAIAVGDASHDRLAALVAGAFGEWASPEGVDTDLVDVASLDAPPSPAGRVVTVHRTGAAQSELRMGHIGLARSTPDYHALLVMNMILGGQFVSRINMNLREEKGYTYGARTSFEFRKGPGPFVFQTSVQSDVTAEAVREVLAEIKAIRGGRPVTAAELELGRAALTRGYPRNFETAEQLGRAAVQLALYGLPDDYFTTFVPRVLAIDEHDVTRVAEDHLAPERLLTVIVGDRDKVGPTLEGLDLGEVSEVAIA
jgi:zinc protease